MGDFRNRLKDLGIIKNKQKKLYNAIIQKIYCLKIWVNAKVKKKCLDIKKELYIYQLVLEEKQQKIWILRLKEIVYINRSKILILEIY